MEPNATTDLRQPEWRDRATRRYRDAYFVASAITKWATFIKLFGILVGLVILGTSVWIATEIRDDETAAAVGIIGSAFGLAVTAWFYLLGVIIAAQGQILKASIDGAVHSSPFLSTSERAAAMSL